MLRFRSLAPVLLLALCACSAPPAREVPPTPLRAQTLPADCPDPATVRALSRASAGLLYPSETDAPLSFVWYPLQSLPTPAGMADLAGIPATVAEVETRDFAALFARLGTVPAPGTDPAARDAARRFRVLGKAVQARYATVAIYRVRDRVNDPAVWKVFILGTDRCGTSGLETWVLET